MRYASDVSLSSDMAIRVSEAVTVATTRMLLVPSAEARSSASAVVTTTSATERATTDDYTLVLVPWGVGTGVFGVVAVRTDAVHGAIWGVALFLITIIAMRDDEFSKFVARAARFLRGE